MAKGRVKNTRKSNHQGRKTSAVEVGDLGHAARFDQLLGDAVLIVHERPKKPKKGK